MGKKTRIVLLAVTVVIAVFTFGMMWAVRPNAQDPVLEAARERQSEPLLSVSEPLETDTAAISAEEKMAEKVAALLSSDEEFISALSNQIAANVSLDDYIPEITETVYSRIAEDFDENLESGVLALYEKYSKALTSDIVMAILEEYDALSTEEKADVLSMDEIVTLLYDRYRGSIISDIAASISIDIADDSVAIATLTEEEARAIAEEIYEANKEEIISEAENRILADYSALSTKEKIAILSLEDQILVLYDSYRDALVEDILSEAPETLDRAAVEGIIIAMYEINRDYIVSELLSELPEVETLSEEEVSDIIYGLYDENRDWIVSDIASELDSLSEDDIIAMYDEYAAFIADDVARRVHGDEEAEIAVMSEEAAEPEVQEEVIEEIPEEPVAEETAVPEPVVEETAPQKTQISVPSFSASVAPDASAEEYQAAREAQRRSEIEKALSFIQ